MKRKHWSEYDDIHYGEHEYGIGVYRKNEFWLDYELAADTEKLRYEQYLKENNYDS